MSWSTFSKPLEISGSLVYASHGTYMPANNTHSDYAAQHTQQLHELGKRRWSIYIYIHGYIYIFVCVYIYIHICIYSDPCAHLCFLSPRIPPLTQLHLSSSHFLNNTKRVYSLLILTFKRTHAHTHTRTHAHTHARARACAHTHTYTHTHIHTYTHAYMRTYQGLCG